MNERSSRTTSKIFGHEPAIDQLLSYVRSGHLPHGLIISGPRGIGKATIAYQMARMMLAGSNEWEMKESHPVFRRVAAGSHSDLLVVEPEFNEKKGEQAQDISAEQARHISEFMSLTPGESQWRVVIIDSVDQLNTQGANAILKILEEPPPQALLLLVSHMPGLLLPTIRSRCQQIKCTALPPMEFSRALSFSNPALPAERHQLLGMLSGYAPGLAAQYEEQGAPEYYEQITRLFQSAPSLDPLAIHAFSEEVTASKHHAQWQLLTRLLLTFFERTAKHTAGVRQSFVTSDEAQAIERLSTLHSAAAWAGFWQQASQYLTQASRLHLDYKQIIITFFHAAAHPKLQLTGA